jgi:hypothetical protein
MQIQVIMDASERLREALMRLLSFVLLVVHLFQLSLLINLLKRGPGRRSSIAECCSGEINLGGLFQYR